MKKDDKRFLALLVVTGSSLIASIVFFVKSEAYKIDGIDSTMACICTFIFIISFIVLVVTTCSSEDKRIKDWTYKTYKDNNINKDNIKFNLGNKLYHDRNRLIYTKDKRLFIFEEGRKINQVDLSSILKIDAMYPNHVIAPIKIIIDDEIHTIYLDYSQESIDKANQFKLILDRELESLNK